MLLIGSNRRHTLNYYNTYKDVPEIMIRKITNDLRNDIKQLNGSMKLFDRILMVVGLLFCFVTMYYADITVTGQYGLTFWDSLFDLKFLSFYENALSNGVAPEGAVYDIGTYVFFGIWQFPVWILNKLFGISPLAVGSLLWLKLLPVTFAVLSANEVMLLGQKAGVKDNYIGVLGVIFLLSSTVILPVFVVAQYDVISLYFMVRAIRELLDNNEKMFYILFAISMTVKPITILALFVIVLLRDKNIVKIILNLVKGSSLMILCKLIYSLNEAYRVSCSGFLQKNMPNLFNVSLNFGWDGELSIFVLGLVFVYAIAYLSSYSDIINGNNSVVRSRLIIFYVFAVWAVFVAFGSPTCYWTIYMAPFAVLVSFMNSNSVGRFLLIEAAMNVALTIVLVLHFTWVYGGDHTFSYLILKTNCKWVEEGVQRTTVAGLFRWLLSGGSLAPAILAVFVGCIMIMVICSYKDLRENYLLDQLDNDPKDIDVTAEKSVIWNIRLRILLLWIWILFELAAFYFSLR